MKYYLAIGSMMMGCSTLQPQPLMGGQGNPVTLYCLAQGGQLIKMQQADGGEYANCQLPTGQFIEEWELYRKNLD